LGSAFDMAQAVRIGALRATDLVQASLARVAATDGAINAFTDLTTEQALADAARIDATLAAGESSVRELPLLGVPFAVKNLFDVAGLTTLAGSKIEREQPPKARDALLVQRLKAAGAVLVGALNMDEYAYGFTTENSHDGPCRNPHDTTRISGGSSGGSAAAVAAGQVPLSLGSDTNGSIRVPASLCGVFGLKPTFGRLPRSGTYPFVSSLDHLGPFARSTRDLALTYDALQTPVGTAQVDPEADAALDPGWARRAPEPTSASLRLGSAGLRIATLGGYFEQHASAEARTAVAHVARALGVQTSVELPLVEAGRAAAFLISNATGGALHLDDLRRRAQDFEPLSRDRFIAGALLPAAWVERAQRVRLRYARAVAEVLMHHDVLLAPATPCSATAIGQEHFELGGQRLLVRPSMGLLTQPISCIGLPVCAVPVWLPGAALPIGVQVIAAPWREDLVLRVAAELERLGAVHAPVAA
jgi:amidase/aspartyl-tRNA(Asn)/glutamyl-tRNA(Gln) amidotransferase subunit A